MTLAVAVAKSTGEDVSQTLLDRAAVEDNPVRQGILQLMADKRFLNTVSPVMMWQEDAAEALEEFANSLESLRKSGTLTQEAVDWQIEEFFAVWYMLRQKRKPVYEVSRKARKKAKMEAIGKNGKESGTAGEGKGETGSGRMKGEDISKALSNLVDSENETEDDANLIDKEE